MATPPDASRFTRVWGVTPPRPVRRSGPSQINELRLALDQARFAIGLLALVYTDQPIAAGVTTIKPAHGTSLRDGVK